MSSSEVPRQNIDVSFTSPFSGNSISPFDNIGPIPTQDIPYPEWRINVVVQARKAELGAIGNAMNLIKSDPPYDSPVLCYLLTHDSRPLQSLLQP